MDQEMVSASKFDDPWVRAAHRARHKEYNWRGMCWSSPRTADEQRVDEELASSPVWYVVSTGGGMAPPAKSAELREFAGWLSRWRRLNVGLIKVIAPSEYLALLAQHGLSPRPLGIGQIGYRAGSGAYDIGAATGSPHFELRVLCIRRPAEYRP